MPWPPQYTIRHSKRAKRVSMRIYAGSGLEVVIPQRQKNFDVLGFINQHRDWIEKHAQQFTFLLPDNADEKALPEIIELKSINKNIDIIYRPINATTGVSYRVDKNKIIFYGAITDFSVCVPAVVQHLKKQAKKYLGELLNQLSIECNLPYQKLSIRGQKTVWGSCTAQKNIQLNYKILFLPKAIARYILIHELCHTVHLNHSVSFWKCVARFVPDFRAQVKLLRQADQFLPRWLA
ncbi:MAG: SprT family zinc-dependent metalloprotease [Gammaproteobacteria bacterium]|nr:SprT family zinc-dependent metalloprotease [Gammaproteobacteria bacterium]